MTVEVTASSIRKGTPAFKLTKPDPMSSNNFTSSERPSTSNIHANKARWGEEEAPRPLYKKKKRKSR
jgi:hypothetical protein